MAKYLDYTGLESLWAKIKAAIPTVDTELDASSSNPIANGGVANVLEQLQFAIANRYPHESERPSSTSDLPYYDIINLYDEDIDTSIMLLAHAADDTNGYGNFESLDGNYKIYNQSGTWYYKAGDASAVAVSSSLLSNLTGYIPQIQAVTDSDLDSTSDNPVANSGLCYALYNFLDNVNLFAVDNSPTVDQLNLDQYTKLDIYVQSTDSLETLYKVGYRRFQTIDGSYKILYSNSSWHYYVGSTEGTFTLSNIQCGYRPNYAAINQVEQVLTAMFLTNDWEYGTITAASQLTNWDVVNLTLIQGEDSVDLWRVNGNTYDSIVPHNGHTYKLVQYNATTLRYYIDEALQQSAPALTDMTVRRLAYAYQSDVRNLNSKVNNIIGVLSALDYEYVGEPSVNSDISKYDKIYLYISDGDYMTTLYRVSNNYFTTIEDNDHAYSLTYTGSVWTYQIDGTTQGSVPLSNMTGYKIGYTTTDDRNKILDALLKMFDYKNEVVTVSNLPQFDYLNLYMSDDDYEVQLYRISDSQFQSIRPVHGHTFRITTSGNFYIDEVSQTFPTQNITGYSVRYADKDDVERLSNVFENVFYFDITGSSDINIADRVDVYIQAESRTVKMYRTSNMSFMTIHTDDDVYLLYNGTPTTSSTWTLYKNGVSQGTISSSSVSKYKIGYVEKSDFENFKLLLDTILDQTFDWNDGIVPTTMAQLGGHDMVRILTVYEDYVHLFKNANGGYKSIYYSEGTSYELRYVGSQQWQYYIDDELQNSIPLSDMVCFDLTYLKTSDVDTALSESSSNPVRNSVITNALWQYLLGVNNFQSGLTPDSASDVWDYSFLQVYDSNYDTSYLLIRYFTQSGMWFGGFRSIDGVYELRHNGSVWKFYINNVEQQWFELSDISGYKPTLDVDDALDSTSYNAVGNYAITTGLERVAWYLYGLNPYITETPTAASQLSDYKIISYTAGYYDPTVRLFASAYSNQVFESVDGSMKIQYNNPNWQYKIGGGSWQTVDATFLSKLVGYKSQNAIKSDIPTVDAAFNGNSTNAIANGAVTDAVTVFESALYQLSGHTTSEGETPETLEDLLRHDIIDYTSGTTSTLMFRTTDYDQTATVYASIDGNTLEYVGSGRNGYWELTLNGTTTTVALADLNKYTCFDTNHVTENTINGYISAKVCTQSEINEMLAANGFNAVVIEEYDEIEGGTVE